MKQVLTVNVTEAEDALLTFLRTGQMPETLLDNPAFREDMIASGATEAELDEQRADWENEMAKISRKLKKFLRGVK